jgi:hypothetical protein
MPHITQQTYCAAEMQPIAKMHVRKCHEAAYRETNKVACHGIWERDTQATIASMHDVKHTSLRMFPPFSAFLTTSNDINTRISKFTILEEPLKRLPTLQP